MSNSVARHDRSLRLFLVDNDAENSIEHLQLRVNRQIITPLQLQQLNENFFFYIIERFNMFAKFVGRVCARRMIIDLN